MPDIIYQGKTAATCRGYDFAPGTATRVPDDDQATLGKLAGNPFFKVNKGRKAKASQESS